MLNDSRALGYNNDAKLASQIFYALIVQTGTLEQQPSQQASAQALSEPTHS
jgi:hypothetical protein